MPPNRFESEVESFLEGSHGDRTHIKRADHHTVTPLCGTLLALHPLRGAAPVTWRCTRYVALHPNRRGAMPTDRVQRTQSQEQTRNLRDDRRHAEGALKNKTCWFCREFSACWCGKIGIEGGGRQREGWTQRVGCVVTCRLAGAGQSTVKGELSWAAIHQARGVPPVLDVRSGAGPEAYRLCLTCALVLGPCVSSTPRRGVSS